jgi:hypothetical protein
LKIIEVVLWHTLQDILLATGSTDEKSVDCRAFDVADRPKKQDTQVQAALVSFGECVRRDADAPIGLRLA